MMVKIEARARLITILLVRPQSARRGGMNMGRSCSNSPPIAVATVLKSSRGIRQSLVRSEFIALMIGLCDVLSALTNSDGAAS